MLSGAPRARPPHPFATVALMNTALHYAVLGAGIAGLSCARALADAGARVTVLDKSRGPGGRMSTRRGDGWACDHGAQYFTARDPAFQAELGRWQAAGAAARWEPRLVVFDADRRRDSGGAEARYVGTPRMTAPARLLADGLDLRVQTTVTALQCYEHGWELATAERGVLAEAFDGVLLAVPAPQALPLLQPVLPALAELAGGARMQACWALMLRFETPLALTSMPPLSIAGPCAGSRVTPASRGARPPRRKSPGPRRR